MGCCHFIPARWFARAIFFVWFFVAAACTGIDSRREAGVRERGAGPEREGEGQERQASSADLQRQVMDFSDQYTSAIVAALDRYLLVETDPAKQVAAQNWKVRYGAAAMTIAAARDPRVNLLDMAVFVSAAKWVVESYWIPQVFGPKAKSLEEAHCQMEKQILLLAGRVLSLRQQADLGELVRLWERGHPGLRDVTNVRLRNLDGVRLNAFDDGRSARGIMAGVRKFIGRVDTSLLAGERLMFMAGRTPHILSQQTDLTLSQIGQAFPIATVRPEAIAAAVNDLPEMLQEAIDRNRGPLGALVPRIATLLDNAGTLAASLDSSLLTVRELAEKSDGSALAASAAMIGDADRALAHLDSSIAGVNRILDRNAAGEFQTDEIVRQIDARAERIVDGAFRRALVLIGLFFVGVFAALLLARFLFRKKGA